LALPLLEEHLGKPDRGDPFEIMIPHSLTKGLCFEQCGASLLELSRL
jgi:hypothetical protein